MKSTFKKGETITTVNLNNSWESIFIEKLPAGKSEFLVKCHRSLFRIDVDKTASSASAQIWQFDSKRPTKSRYESGCYLIFCQNTAVITREIVDARAEIEMAQSLFRRLPDFKN